MQIPHSIWVVLEDDLVDTCKAGDKVLVTGVIRQRWKPLGYSVHVTVEPLGYSVHVYNGTSNHDTLK